MQPGIYNLVITQEGMLALTITWKPGGVLADFTGWTARLRIRKTNTRNTILTLTQTPDEDGNCLTLGGTAGTIGILINSVTTLGLNMARCKWDLFAFDLQNQGHPILKGNVVYDEQVPA